MARKTITLSNSYHGTEYRTTKSQDEIDHIDLEFFDFRPESSYLTPAQIAWARKVRRTLCPSKDCCCATTSLGERG